MSPRRLSLQARSCIIHPSIGSLGGGKYRSEEWRGVLLGRGTSASGRESSRHNGGSNPTSPRLYKGPAPLSPVVAISPGPALAMSARLGKVLQLTLTLIHKQRGRSLLLIYLGGYGTGWIPRLPKWCIWSLPTTVTNMDSGKSSFIYVSIPMTIGYLTSGTTMVVRSECYTLGRKVVCNILIPCHVKALLCTLLKTFWLLIFLTSQLQNMQKFRRFWIV